MNVRRALITCLAGLAVWSTGVDAQTAARSMTVFVTVGPLADLSTDEAARKIANAKISAAIEFRKQLERTLKAKHGNNRGKWPKDAQDAYAEAEEAVAAGNADWIYRTKQDKLADSVADIKKAVAGIRVRRKEHVIIVESRGDAQLVVEVLGRRFEVASDSRYGEDMFWILFSVKAGPKLSAERFAAVPRDYRLPRNAVPRLAAARPESAEWRFEAFNAQEWFNTANSVSNLIEDFIAKNYDAMMGG